ncbi:PIPO, partial [Thunberg fritillary mosaic virus]|uniref:PIPO n=1 Tax=Thunberg fritillary mosaic virus TaxID=299200 RepID=UPI00026512F7
KLHGRFRGIMARTFIVGKIAINISIEKTAQKIFRVCGTRKQDRYNRQVLHLPKCMFNYDEAQLHAMCEENKIKNKNKNV